MQANEKARVIIAGGGTAGWLTAYSLGKRLGKLLDITLVESDLIGTVGVGEATIPTMRVFHDLVEINEPEFMRATQATFKLGISLENWANIGDRYIHSFGVLGQSTWMAEFHEFWLEARARGVAGPLEDYCLELKAAGRGKFATEVNKNRLLYAYHLDATAYARYLRQQAEALGVLRLEGRIGGAELHAESGDLTGLQLDDGRRLAGDVFIDCTGFRALLLGEYLKVGFEDWSHWLASDRAIAVQTESTEPPVPYTRAIAHPAGWQWRIPLQGRTGNGIIYCSRYLSDDEARHTLLNNLSGRMLTEPHLLRFTTGRRVKSWHRNCIAIGLSSGFLEPLESTSIHLIVTAVARLMRLFPFSGNKELLAEEYNRLTNTELEAVRDFVIMHYKLTQRNDSAFWNVYRTMAIPEALAHRMAIFQKNGFTSSDAAGLFHVTSWVQVMMGQGLYPEQHHGASRLLPPAALKEQLDKISGSVNMNLARMPDHHEFLRKYCLSPLAKTAN
ncbi:MAG: tryptophan 7-halogenase [Gammaproteobacteria bacterium]|nr:tryptophan 7-halogenase [Gammaproteobacteria bacterium]